MVDNENEDHMEDYDALAYETGLRRVQQSKTFYHGVCYIAVRKRSSYYAGSSGYIPLSN